MKVYISYNKIFKSYFITDVNIRYFSKDLRWINDGSIENNRASLREALSDLNKRYNTYKSKDPDFDDNTKVYKITPKK